VTDADLVLGYLNPDNFLGGALKLDKGKAGEALSTIAKRMNKNVVETAHAIFKIMNAQMADLIRKCTVERGFDPRNFSLLAFGGAGPTHVPFYGADVGAKSMFIVPNATVFSAFGMLTSPITHYVMASRRMQSPYSKEDCQELTNIFASSTGEILAQFAGEGIPSNTVEITKSVSIRYKMQVHEIEVEIREGNITPEILQDTVIPRFENKYSEIYGAGTEAKEAGTELITCKIVGRYYGFVIKETTPKSFAESKQHSGPKLKGKRRAFFEEKGQLVGIDTAIFNGDHLSAGDLLQGPSIVERYGDAIVIPPGYQGEVDSWGTISLTRTK
jgi:N-methylhydantoinase A